MKPPILHTLCIVRSLNEQAASDWPPCGTVAFHRNRPSAEVKLERACRPCRRNRQGAAVVEFAVVAPIFSMLVFGMIEFGRAIMVEQILTNAAREGARVAVLDSATSDEREEPGSHLFEKCGHLGGHDKHGNDQPDIAHFGSVRSTRDRHGSASV